jgi:hypothetical protein
MSKVALASIKSLTFYADGVTAARRTEPLPQLNCIGKACSLYTPEVIRCTNVGGHGTDIDWKVCIPKQYLSSVYSVTHTTVLTENCRAV